MKLISRPRLVSVKSDFAALDVSNVHQGAITKSKRASREAISIGIKLPKSRHCDHRAAIQENLQSLGPYHPRGQFASDQSAGTGLVSKIGVGKIGIGTCVAFGVRPTAKAASLSIRSIESEISKYSSNFIPAGSNASQAVLKLIGPAVMAQMPRWQPGETHPSRSIAKKSRPSTYRSAS